MISLREALTIHDGHTIHDYCGRTLNVHNYSVSYEKGLPVNVEFGCRDIYTNERLVYSYEEIYISYEDLSDECKLFLIWLRKDGDCYLRSNTEIKELKLAFMSGFNNGYSYKLRHSAEEQLQK